MGFALRLSDAWHIDSHSVATHTIAEYEITREVASCLVPYRDQRLSFVVDLRSMPLIRIKSIYRPIICSPAAAFVAIIIILLDRPISVLDRRGCA